MKVLITGGAGFIGSYLAKRLLDQHHSVTILDCLSPQIHSDTGTVGIGIDPRALLVKADVRNIELLAQSLTGVEAVVHLAAETGTGQSMYEIQKYTDVNAGGVATLLQLLMSGTLPDVQRVVVASSRAVYGEGKYVCTRHGFVYPFVRPAEQLASGDFSVHCPYCNDPAEPMATDESTPVNPLSIYGLTKYYQEQAVLLFAQARGIGAYALRYQNVYGPGQSLTNPYTGILAIFSNQARAGTPIYVFEDGLESRDFVYIDDVVEATARCLSVEGKATAVLNVGTGKPTPVIEVARAISQYFGGKSEVKINGAYRAGDIRHNYADTSRINALLGVQASWSFASGLKSFLSWVETQQSHHDSSRKYQQSLDELQSRGLMSR